MLPKIAKVPILFLAGAKDEIVPHSHMQQLFKLCRSPIKEWHTFPDGTHNDTVGERGYFDYVEWFIKKHIARYR